jgi:hypothetical protein
MSTLCNQICLTLQELLSQRLIFRHDSVKEIRRILTALPYSTQGTREVDLFADNEGVHTGECALPSLSVNFLFTFLGFFEGFFAQSSNVLFRVLWKQLEDVLLIFDYATKKGVLDCLIAYRGIESDEFDTETACAWLQKCVRMDEMRKYKPRYQFEEYG